MPVSPRNWLLVPSPLLGPSSWRGVADILREDGHRVAVPAPAMTTVAADDHVGPWIEDVVKTADSLGHPDPVVVVAHSQACARAPMLVDCLVRWGRPVEAMVLVDGRFPDGRSLVESEPQFGEVLDGLVRPDDYLPPWPRWWGSYVSSLVVSPVASDLLPNQVAMSEAVLNEASPIPRTWFDLGCPVPELSPDLGRAYLGFGESYAEARRQAKRNGWYTLQLTGDHLHQVVAPDAVAATLVAVVMRLAGENPSTVFGR